LDGAYCSLAAYAKGSSAARHLVNLVNVQGTGPIYVRPVKSAPSLAAELELLDSTKRWRNWWREASGTELEFSPTPVERLEPPTLALGQPDRETITVGINVGGHYLRVVRCRGKVIERSHSVRIGSGTSSLLSDLGLAGLADPVQGMLDGVTAVGIAWAAPSVERHVHPLSMQTRVSAEVAALLGEGNLERQLARRWKCAVSSWNDGQAVAASQVSADADRAPRSQLVLKLGTSIAAGLVRDGEVVDLPLEMAKCLLDVQPLLSYEHPTVGLQGTARDLIGADPLVATYRTLSRREDATFADLQQDALASPRAEARLVLERAARGVAALARFAQSLWRDLELVVTGRNLSDRRVRDLFLALVRDDLERTTSGIPVRSSSNDPDLSAAHGGAILAQSV
jgi:predicted NBD/HSP70 family sugar kinase